jgi:hypothetical protein
MAVSFSRLMDAHSVIFQIFLGSASVAFVHPSVILDRNVTWSRRTLWKLPYRVSLGLFLPGFWYWIVDTECMQYEIMNTWYVASRVMPLYRARKMNDSGWFHPPLPSLDDESIVYTGQPSSMFAFDWAQKVIELSLGNSKPQLEHCAYL